MAGEDKEINLTLELQGRGEQVLSSNKTDSFDISSLACVRREPGTVTAQANEGLKVEVGLVVYPLQSGGSEVSH